ncbi:MAG: hypothetical protein ABI361_06275 [Nitrososphaera sp.]
MAFNKRKVIVSTIAVYATILIAGVFVDAATGITFAALATLPAILVLATLSWTKGKWNDQRGIAPTEKLRQFGSENLRQYSGIRGQSAFCMRLPDARTVAIAFLLVMIVIEIGALARWLTYPIFPTEMYSDPSWKFANIESALYHSFGLLSSFIIVLLAFSFLFRNQIQDIPARIKGIHHSKSLNGNKSVVSNGGAEGPNNDENLPARIGSNPYQLQARTVIEKKFELPFGSRKQYWPILLCALIVAPLMTIYPHLPGVNPVGSGVSTDEKYYVDSLKQLRNLNGQDQVKQLFKISGGDRPLSLAFMMWLGDITKVPDPLVIRYLPLILAPASVASVYLLVRYTFQGSDARESKLESRKFASIAAILAAVSPQLVVGIYAGIFANWLALIPATLSIVLIIKTLDLSIKSKARQIDWIRIALYSLGLFGTLSLTMLLHVYTWGFLVITSIVFTLITTFTLLRSHRENAKDILVVVTFVAIVIGATVVSDFAKSSYFSVRSGLSRDAILTTNSVDLGNFFSRWDTINFTSTSYLGGFLLSPVILILCLLWLLQSNYFRGLDRFILSMIFVLTVPLLFGSNVIQARIIYVVPLFIPAALSLGLLKRTDKTTFGIVVAAAALSMTVYALRAMANFYLIAPQYTTLDEPFLMP